MDDLIRRLATAIEQIERDMTFDTERGYDHDYGSWPDFVLRGCAADRKMLDELGMRIYYTPSTDREVLNHQQIRAQDATDLLGIMAERYDLEVTSS